MSYRSFFVLKLLFASASIITFISAAILEFLDRWQTDVDREKSRRLYHQIWLRTIKSGLFELPEKIILWILHILNKFNNYLVGKSYINYNLQIKRINTILLTFIAISFIYSGLSATRKVLAPIFLSLAIIVIFILIKKGGVIWALNLDVWNLAVNAYYSLGIFILFQLVLLLPIYFATLVFLVMGRLFIFCFSILFLTLFAPRGKKEFQTAWLFGFGISASFFITFISLSFGHYIEPGAYVPKTLQMVFSNSFFDGLSLIITIKILSLAVGSSRKLSIPIAIFFDIILAGLFACTSLWIGLVGTKEMLSFQGILFVLIGKSSNGAQFAFGPYFWAMHSVFIPSLIYLLIILLCWMGKIFVLPIAKLFSRARYVDKPHRLTAGALLLLAAIFGGIWKGIDLIEQYQNKTTPENELNIIHMPIIEYTDRHLPSKGWAKIIRKVYEE